MVIRNRAPGGAGGDARLGPGGKAAVTPPLEDEMGGGGTGVAGVGRRGNEGRGRVRSRLHGEVQAAARLAAASHKILSAPKLREAGMACGEEEG